MDINGKKYDFDLYDADQGPVYLEHAEKISTIAGAMRGNKSTDPQDLRAAILQLTDAVRAMLDEVFGGGAAAEIMGPRNSLSVATSIIDQLNTECEAQKRQMEESAAKYSANRAQRRASRS